MEHHVYGDEWMNLMERMNQAVKDRLECFDDYFPCWKQGCDRAHGHNWIKVFSFIHNHVRIHTALGHPPRHKARETEASRFQTLIIKEVTLK